MESISARLAKMDGAWKAESARFVEMDVQLVR